MADAAYYIQALERLTGVSEAQQGYGSPPPGRLGGAADRAGGPGSTSVLSYGQVGDFSDIRVESFTPGTPGATNRNLADIWEVVRRGNETYYFSNATDAQNRYHATAEAKANEMVASFSGDPEDVREIRNRIVHGESLNSILTDVRDRRKDVNVAAAVAKDNSKAEAMAFNDIRDPNIKESSSIATAVDGSTADATAGSQSASAAHATRESTAGASADGVSAARADADGKSLTSVGAFEQSVAYGKAKDESEATVNAQNGSKAGASADRGGVSRSEARNDSVAAATSRSGDAHAEASNGSVAGAQSSQKDNVKKTAEFEVGKDTKTVWGALRKAGYSNREIVKENLVSRAAAENKLKDPNKVRDGQKLVIDRAQWQRPISESIASNKSVAGATATGKKSDASATADKGASKLVEAGPGQTNTAPAPAPAPVESKKQSTVAKPITV